MKTRKVFFLVFLIMLSLCLVNTQTVKPQSSGTIYIRADGTVEGTDKIQRDGNVYTLTDNIVNQSIIIERDNIVVDGAGYTVQGVGIRKLENRLIADKGISLTGTSNVTIKNVKIKGFYFGISLTDSSNNRIFGNDIENTGIGISLWNSSANTIFGNNSTNNYSGVNLVYSYANRISGNNLTSNYYEGIRSGYSSNNTISGNNIVNNDKGLFLERSSFNTISDNNIANRGAGLDLLYSNGNSIFENNIASNGAGISIDASSGNKIYHNNFIDNSHQALSGKHYGVSTNVWDDGYPSGGNYWSDYAGFDSNRDRIGDTPYVIDANNADHYPLMVPYIIPAIGLHQILAVSIALDPKIVNAGTKVSIQVHVTNVTSDVKDAFVQLMSDKGGIFTPQSGYTDSKGYFTSTFTVPTFTTLTGIKITANATKTGYLSGQSQEQITLSPNLPLDSSQPEPFPTTWIIAAIAIIAVVALLVYFRKIKKTTVKVKKIMPEEVT